jgi:hypothetical protein
MPRFYLTLEASLLAACMTLVPSALAGVDFNREIRLILAENCFYCHGQDPNHRKGNLRLDLREATLKPAESGETAIVPGNAAQSALVTHTFSSERDEQMPPAQLKPEALQQTEGTAQAMDQRGGGVPTTLGFCRPGEGAPARRRQSGLGQQRD